MKKSLSSLAMIDATKDGMGGIVQVGRSRWWADICKDHLVNAMIGSRGNAVVGIESSSLKSANVGH